MSPRGPLAYPAPETPADDRSEPCVVPTMPVQIDLHPMTERPPERESLLVMVRYEDDEPAFADICDFSGGKFLDLSGEEILGEIVAWGRAPLLTEDEVELVEGYRRA